jgi:PKD repeat protein
MRWICVGSTLLLLAHTAVAQPTASITSRRTSGMAPFAYIAEAVDTTHSDPATRTFHDLQYEWDFDDPGAGSWAHSGVDRNRERGPVAGHLYELPGTYSVTLTVIDRLGNVDTDTEAITVHAQTDGTEGCADTEVYCYANTAGTFQGCRLDTDNDGTCNVMSGNCVVTTSLAELGANVADNTCHHFRRGDSWLASGTTSIIGLSGPAIVGTFGVGAKPRMTGTQSMFDVQQSSDWRFVDLDIEDVTDAGPGDVFDAAPSGGGACEIADMTVVRVDMTDYDRCFNLACNTDRSADRNRGIAIVDSQCLMPDRTPNSAVIVDGDYVWESGWTMSSDSTGGGGIFRQSNHLNRSKFAHSQIDGHPNSTEALVIIRTCTLDTDGGSDWCTAAADLRTQYLNFSDNEFISCNNVVHVRLRDDSGSSNRAGRDYLMERNFAHSDCDVAFGAYLMYSVTCAEQVTYRNEIIDCDDPGGAPPGACRLVQAQVSPAPCSIDQQHLLSNTIHAADATGQNIEPGVLGGGSGHICRSNLVWDPLGTNVNHKDCDDVGVSNSNNLGALEMGTSPDPFRGTMPPVGLRTRMNFDLALAGTVAGVDPVEGGFDVTTVVSGQVFDDALGRSRPEGTGYDVGALEARPVPEPGPVARLLVLPAIMLLGMRLRRGVLEPQLRSDSGVKAGVRYSRATRTDRSC